MASGLRLIVHRPTGQLASYVRSFQLLSTEESARVSVLDFAGADVSVPVRFGDPVVVDDPELTLYGSRLYLLDESQKIKDEQVICRPAGLTAG